MRNTIIGVIIAIVVIGGAAWYMTSRQPAATTQTPSASTATTTSGDNTSTANSTQTLKDLAASGQSQKCDFNDTSNDTTTNGTLYVAQGKARADVTSVANAKTTVAHFIMADNTMNVWTDGATTGIKISVDAAQKAQGNSSAQGVDPNKKIAYHCSPWNADASEFTLPASVKFTEFSTPGIQATSGSGATTQSSSGTSIKAQQCAVCDSLSGSQKTQCRAALGCS